MNIHEVSHFPRCHAWILAVLLASSPTAHPASLYTETFSTDLSGWITETEPSWQWTDSHVAISFPEPFFGPLASGTFAALTDASGGAFVGDYRAADIALIGFDFRPDNALPNDAFIELRSEGGSVFAIFTNQISQVGAWRRIVVPVYASADSHWSSIGPTTLEDVITNVTAFTINIQQSSAFIEQTFRVDNIFLARLHTGGPLAFSAPHELHLQWDDLLSNRAYRVEMTSDLLSGQWTPVGTFTASLHTASFTDTNAPAHPLRSYRLVLE